MSQLGLSSIGQIAINVQDLERATAFYRDQLGIPFLFAAGPLVFFDADGIRLMLSRAESPELDHPSSILYFKVSDIHTLFATLKGRGVCFEDEPHRIADMGSYELWMAFFRDSEDNLLSILGEITKD
jgi:predicted enzyme related to lactoylglutathione lyase